MLTRHGTMIAAAGSASGKTILCAALARYHINAGRTVQVVKLGPDFLDPMILQVASGRPVYNLDWWMMGETHCRRLLYELATTCDVLLVESLLGLHDQSPSNAWLAGELDLPVTLLLNVERYAETAGAIVQGMQHFAGRCDVSSVIGNRAGGECHHARVAASMPAGVHYRGSLGEHPSLALPVRHLGLVQGHELPELSAQLNVAAGYLEEAGLDLSMPSFTVRRPVDVETPGCLLEGKVIAVARDRVFSFIYAANIDALQALGARIVYFSPLADEVVPECDALWLPGGYPELALEDLAAATTTQASVLAHVRAGRPGLAECGGMMYLGRSITDVAGRRAAMCNAFDAEFTMHRRFQSIGHQVLALNARQIHGHSFHHSRLSCSAEPIGYWRKRQGGQGEAVFRIGGMTLSYGHLYFAQAPEVAAECFGP